MKKICWEESGPHHARPRRGADADERHADAARHGAGGAGPLVGAADADARPAHRRARRTATCYWRIKAKSNEELRQEFLSIYVPRIFELGLTMPDPELRYDEATGALALHRARLGRTPERRDRPRPDESRSASTSGASTTPPRWVRDAMLASTERRRLSRADQAMSEGSPTTRPSLGGLPAGEPRVTRWSTAGTCMAPDEELALHYAREFYGRRQESDRLWVVAGGGDHRARRPRPAEAALRSVFQAAGRLRHRTSSTRPRRGPAQAQAEGRRMTSRAGPVAARAGGPRRGCCSRIADDEFVIGFWDSEWTGIAPHARGGRGDELDRQDEIGHARALYTLLGGAHRAGSGRDRLRPRAGGLRHARLVDHPRTDWAFTIARR